MGLASLAPVLPIVGQVTEDRIRELYGLPLERFTAERNALAAELRSPEIQALRQPSAAAWAVNQLVRAEPDLVEALLGAGGELRQAHRQAASGRGAQQLRAAAEAERAPVDALVARAPDVLGRLISAALSESIRNTLHAASSDDQARELIASGTLTTELRPVGLGPVPKSTAPSRPERRPDARQMRAAAQSERALQREVDAAMRALERADQSYARAREAADVAAGRAKEARKRLRDARAGLAEAQRARARLERG